MTDRFTLVRGSVPVFEIRVCDSPGTIILNAMSMFRTELETRHGADFPRAVATEGSIVINSPRALGDDDQSFEIRSETVGLVWQITVTGSGERGILYGLCEILDNIARESDATVLPALNLTSSPDIKKRGTERHWPPVFSDQNGVEENIKLIRELARRRVNQVLWIDGWISPAWYRFLDFRHYPKLRRPERESEIREAKDHLRRIVSEAKSWGIDFYLSVTEFNVPARLIEVAPELFHTNESGFPVLKFDMPETWEFYRAKFREMMEDFPEMAGVELWTAEAMDPSICHVEDPEAWPLTRRLEFMYDQTLQAMDEAGRQDARVVCSMFIHHRDGERAYEPLCGKLPERCEGRMKMQVEDYYRFNSPTTLAGKISPGREWIEFDPGGEHRGDWIGWIACHPDYIHERMTHYFDRGVRNFICRIRGFSPGPHSRLVGDYDVLHGVQSIKYDAFFKWCWDIDMPLEEIWRLCKPTGYPDDMLEFYRLSEALSDKTQYVKQCLTNNNHATFLGSIEHYAMKFENNNVYGNEALKEREQVLEPIEENLKLIVEEKEEAVAIAERMQQILKSCRAALPEADYDVLQRTMDYQEQCARVFRYHTEAYFCWKLFEAGKLDGNYDRLISVVQNCEREIRKLRDYDEEQADNAYALIGSIKSLAWVLCCSTQMVPKGIIFED